MMVQCQLKDGKDDHLGVGEVQKSPLPTRHKMTRRLRQVQWIVFIVVGVEVLTQISSLWTLYTIGTQMRPQQRWVKLSSYTLTFISHIPLGTYLCKENKIPCLSCPMRSKKSLYPNSSNKLLGNIWWGSKYKIERRVNYVHLAHSKYQLCVKWQVYFRYYLLDVNSRKRQRLKKSKTKEVLIWILAKGKVQNVVSLRQKGVLVLLWDHQNILTKDCVLSDSNMWYLTCFNFLARVKVWNVTDLYFFGGNQETIVWQC